MNFVREHSPFSNKTERKQSNSRFYFTEDTEEIFTNQTLTVPLTISNLDKGKCSSDIDIARSSALATISKPLTPLEKQSSMSSSMTNLTLDQESSSCSEDSGYQNSLFVKTHNRSKSAGCSVALEDLGIPIVIGSNVNANFVKSNTFPKSTPPVLRKTGTKKKLLQKANSTLGAPVKQLANSGLVSRYFYI